MIDQLAAEGLLYENARAPALWTMPSHATLFTGLPPERHGVGLGRRVTLPEDPPTLAGQLDEAGYDTIGFSENVLVSRQAGFGRGFRRFESSADFWGEGQHRDPGICATRCCESR